MLSFLCIVRPPSCAQWAGSMTSIIRSTIPCRLQIETTMTHKTFKTQVAISWWHRLSWNIPNRARMISVTIRMPTISRKRLVCSGMAPQLRAPASTQDIRHMQISCRRRTSNLPTMWTIQCRDRIWKVVCRTLTFLMIPGPAQRTQCSWTRTRVVHFHTTSPIRIQCLLSLPRRTWIWILDRPIPPSRRKHRLRTHIGEWTAIVRHSRMNPYHKDSIKTLKYIFRHMLLGGHCNRGLFSQKSNQFRVGILLYIEAGPC